MGTLIQLKFYRIDSLKTEVEASLVNDEVILKKLMHIITSQNN